jgi:molybdopterin-containing oxidoreductase family iron-sulfur binding subunit
MPGLDTADFRSWLQGWWKAVVWDGKAGKPGAFESFWTDALQRGGWFQAPAVSGAAVTMSSAPVVASAAAAGSGDMNLVLFPHPFLLDGRHANKPWAQEVPEPLSSYTWGTWAELHPDTAAKIGLAKTDEVVVKTDKGSLTMAWFGSPSIRKDTVAVVMGNGHEGAGRYAGFGANPMKLVGAAVDAGGALKVGAKASVSKAGTSTKMHQYIGNIDTDGRGVNYVVSNEDLGKGHGPASIVAMHHPPVDQRAIDAGILDMYPEPEHPTYRFAMAVDLNRCSGCGACETACFAENNTAIVGPEQIALSRHMGWIRLSRYWEGDGETPDVRFQPVMCQQCSHAPCEGVCPVLATYHNLDGLNAMIYNRCVGTRYCANNCPYTARRFNYHSYKWPESFNLMLNPDVLTREMGVMEKCTFCIQRLRSTKDLFRDEGQKVPDSALQKLTACAQTCPTDAITFGNANDADGTVSKLFQDERAYTMLGELNTKPGVRYLARINFIPAQPLHHGGHGGGGDHGDSHGDSHGGDHGHDHGDGHGDKHGHDAKHSDKH